MTPDPALDVMVYQVEMVDALGDAALGDRWTVWWGRDSEGAFEDEAEAVAAALALAEAHGRPAWLVRAGAAPRLLDSLI
jgi:hypothetical protein